MQNHTDPRLNIFTLLPFYCVKGSLQNTIQCATFLNNTEYATHSYSQTETNVVYHPVMYPVSVYPVTFLKILEIYFCCLTEK